MLFVLAATLFANAQTVAINNDNSASPNTTAMLEIKKSNYSKLKIRSTSYIGDTAVLELSNRNLSGVGSDLFSQIGEAGLVISSQSYIFVVLYYQAVV